MKTLQIPAVMRKTGTPAAMRKLGIVARVNFLIGGIISVIYCLIIGRSLCKNLPDWGALNFNRYSQDEISTALSANYGELPLSILLIGIFTSFILWFLFASRLSIVKLRMFRNVKYGVTLFSALYLWQVFINYGDGFTDLQEFFFGGSSFLILFLYQRGFSFTEPKREGETLFIKGREIGSFYEIGEKIIAFNGIAVFSFFLVVQYFYPNPYVSTIFWIIVPPIVILYFKNLIVIVVEYVKEHPWYRKTFVIGRYGESARWGSFYSFFNKELFFWFALNRETINFSKKSAIYYGKTLWQYDFQIRGRHIGTKNEAHVITCAGARSGKSVDVIYTNLLNYAGGVIALDPKGEITQVVWKRRSKIRPFYALDPFGVVIGKEDSGVSLRNSHWNPLDEIDVKHPEAREHIKTLAEACIEKSKSETGNSAHFRETAQIVLRGVIAYVLSDPLLKESQRHLGTVFNFIKYGTAEAGIFSLNNVDSFIEIKLTTNKAVNGAAKEAANILLSVAEKEKGAILSTLTRGIDWINSPLIQKIICHKSDFSLSDAKSKEASIFLILPEEHLQKFSRLTAVFYTLAIDKCSNHVTPQPKGSKRRVLFLMEEFSKLGYFAPIAQKITIAAGSYLKFWFIVQTLGQLTKVYDNSSDFFSSSDLQVFALDRKDFESAKYISDVLGSYTVKKGQGTETFKLMQPSEVTEFLDINTKNQILFPRGGNPLQLKRLPFYKLFQNNQYGRNTY